MFDECAPQETWSDLCQQKSVLLHAHTLSRPGFTRIRVELHATANKGTFVLVMQFAGPEPDAPRLNAFKIEIEDGTTEYVTEFYASYLQQLAPGQTFVEEDFAAQEPAAAPELSGGDGGLKPVRKADTTIEQVRPFFKYPINEASKRLGICSTSLKKICRANGLQRWPYRKVKSMETKMAQVKAYSSPNTPMRSQSLQASPTPGSPVHTLSGSHSMPDVPLAPPLASSPMASLNMMSPRAMPHRQPSRLAPALRPAMTAPPPVGGMCHAPSMAPALPVRPSSDFPLAHGSFSSAFDNCMQLGEPPVPITMDIEFDLPILDNATALLCLDLLSDDREQLPLPTMPPSAFAQHVDFLGQPVQQQHMQMYPSGGMHMHSHGHVQYNMDSQVGEALCA